MKINVEFDNIGEMREFVAFIHGGAAPKVNWQEIQVGSGAYDPDEADPTEADATAKEDARQVQDTPEPEGRLYGRPDASRARRTKDEMAQDEEIEKLADQLGVNLAGAMWPADKILADLTEKAAAQEKPAISTGEERVDPAQEPEEAPEPLTGEVMPDEPKVTREDLKPLMHRMLDEKHNGDMAATMEKFKELLGVGKQSDIPDDQIPAAHAKLSAYVDG